jgi:DNA polymerase-3 subunit chi
VKVEFHTGVADKLEHSCRLLRKTQVAGARVVVGGDGALLDRLDVLLWTFDALSFVAHARVRRAGAGALAATRQRSDLWLADDPSEFPHRDVLINLGPEMVAQWEQFARVIEVVEASPQDSATARQRWRRYGQREGVELVNHSIGGQA